MLKRNIDMKSFTKWSTLQQPLKGGQAGPVQFSLFAKAFKSPFEGELRGMALLLVLILIPLWSFAQQSPQANTQLDQYLQEAAKNNPELKARVQEYLAALQQVPQVNTFPDPAWSLGYSINPIETRSGHQQARL